MGKLADVIVLSADLRMVSPFQITRTPVVLTVLGGREVWRDSTAFK